MAAKTAGEPAFLLAKLRVCRSISNGGSNFINAGSEQSG